MFKTFFSIIVALALAAAGWWVFVRDQGQPETKNPSTSSGQASNLPPDDGRFRWGVGIRPYALNRYSEELMAEQLDLARELGTHWVRLSWHGWHGEGAFAWHDKVIDMARARGLHVVLILEEINAPTNELNAPENARKKVKEIVAHYKGRVDYFQLLNEVSGAALKGSEFPGTNFERDYDLAIYQELRDWLKGAAQGAKEGNPHAKTLLTGQWTHTAMFERLIKDGAPFDILGWNWFSDMGEDLNGPVISKSLHQTITLLDKLKGFGKELWITELNFRPGESGMDEAKQAAYLKRTVERINGYQTFKALFVFELLDQSEVLPKGGKPEYYGIVKFDKDSQGNWIIGGKKLAFEAYKRVITKLSQ